MMLKVCIILLALGAGKLCFAGDHDVIAQNIDQSIKPGDDFYLFSNGTWIKNNPIPNAYSRWGIGNLIQNEIWQKLKDINEKALANSPESKIAIFYSSAMNEKQIEKAGLAPLQHELNMIDAIQDHRSLFKVISHFQRLSVFAAFEINISPDLKNSNTNILYLGQGGLSLPNRDYYLKHDAHARAIILDFQTQHLPKMLGFLGKKFKEGAQDVYLLEKALARYSKNLENLRDPHSNYHAKTMAQLLKFTPNIPWRDIFTDWGIKTDFVVVGQPEFYTHLNTLVKSTPITTWKNYLRFRLLSTFAPYLNSELDQENFRFFSKTVNGQLEPLPRWKRAIKWEEEAFGELLGKYYVEENFPLAKKKRYTELCSAIFLAFSDRIRNLEWMSNATKEKALAKLKVTKLKIGYPDQWRDTSAMIIDSQSLVENIKSANQFWFSDYSKKINQAVNKSEWEMTPQTYNAYYSPSKNEIVLPAAIFELPGVNDEEIDDAIIYGYVGASTIGHEITHGYDDQGRQFDQNGNLKNWWNKSDEEKFNRKVNAYIQQFNEYVVLKNVHVNGKATIGENIADLGGLVIALDAFKKTIQYKEGKLISGFTPMQRFFLGYSYGWLRHQRDSDLRNTVLTDYHAPSFLRVNGPFSNIDEFYDAFAIKEGDKMYRPKNKRVKIW